MQDTPLNRVRRSYILLLNYSYSTLKLKRYTLATLHVEVWPNLVVGITRPVVVIGK